MTRKGVEPDVARTLFDKLIAFASYGFPESHAISFAQIVYSSAWFKRYYPAAFCAGLLRAQPMGFYSPQSLVADARRHGVVVRGPDVNASAASATLEPVPEERPALRLGLDSVRHIGSGLAEQIAAVRAERPYADLADLAERVPLTAPQAEALATAGAFGCFGLSRREALWAAGALAGAHGARLPGTATGVRAPTLPGMTAVERTVADLWATGITTDGYPTELLRGQLTARGILSTDALRTAEPDRRVWVGGIVTHRQRPATAGGVTFLNLEDETGMANIVCSQGLWARYRRVARTAAALLVRGRLERSPEGVVNLLADRLEPLPMPVAARSRDFR